MERTERGPWLEIARIWWRANRARGIRSLVLVGLAAGAVAGTAVAAVDGARRTATVLDRASDAGREPDVLVVPDRPGFDWAPVMALPEIDALLRIGGPVCALDLPLDVEGNPLCGEIFLDRNVGDDIARGAMDAGREPDLERPDEIVVSRSAAELWGIEVGDTFSIAEPTAAQIEHAFATGEFATPVEFLGPRLEAHVVGIAAPILGDRLLGTDEGLEGAAIFATPAFAELGFSGYANAMVRLRPGVDADAFSRRVAEVAGEPVPVRDLADDTYRVDRSLLIERWALLAFAGSVLVAGAVLVGQALARQVRTTAADVDVLVVLGLTRREAVGLVAAPFVVVAAAAVGATVGAATALSTQFPIGLARELEPSLGVHLDALVLAVGLVVVVLAMAMRVWLSARSAVAEAGAVPARAGRPSSPSARAGRRWPTGLPVPVALGARLALAPPRSGRAGDGPARGPVLVGAAIGVLGIVGAWTFRDGLDGVLRDGSLAGTTWDHVADIGPERELPDLTGVPGVRAVVEVERAVTELDGQTVSLWTFVPRSGDIPRVVLEGRLPSGPDEATIGWGTARTLDVDVGDDVSSWSGVSYRVVGIGLLPEEPGHSAYDQGLWVTPDGLARLELFEVANRRLLLDLAGSDGSDGSAVEAALTTAAGFPIDVRDPDEPAASRNLANIRRLPLALAVFLAALALGVSAHAVTTTIRRHRHDFAVLRALGATRRQIRTVVASQATTIGVVGIVVGVPLGLLAARAGWRWIARSVPFIDDDPIAVVATILVVPAVLAAVNLVAGVPARRAASARPAEVLRTE